MTTRWILFVALLALLARLAACADCTGPTAPAKLRALYIAVSTALQQLRGVWGLP